MNKVLEEEIAAKSNYAMTAGKHVGETSRTKASFLPEVLEISKKFGDTTECIRKPTR